MERRPRRSQPEQLERTPSHSKQSRRDCSRQRASAHAEYDGATAQLRGLLPPLSHTSPVVRFPVTRRQPHGRPHRRERRDTGPGPRWPTASASSTAIWRHWKPEWNRRSSSPARPSSNTSDHSQRRSSPTLPLPGNPDGRRDRGHAEWPLRFPVWRGVRLRPRQPRAARFLRRPGPMHRRWWWGATWTRVPVEEAVWAGSRPSPRSG